MNRYSNLDGLRSLAAIGIICMHVRSNIGCEIFGGLQDYVINTLIVQMGVFVQLFYIISGFSMCCGYYGKIKNNQISLNRFYSRRYEKILPFFTLLVLIDLAVGFLLNGSISLGSFAEAFADITLMFGFYTTSGMSVIGVGWSLGVIFGFYILFPFFVYLIWNKKRAWFSLIITIIIHLLCALYFKSGSSLSFRWMCYFVLGGLIYLYRDSISKLFEGKVWLGIVFVLIGFAVVFMIPYSGTGLIKIPVRLIKNIIGYTMMLSGALCAESKLWSNPLTRLISGVSLEIYIAHMFIFRIIEKLGLTAIAGGNAISYAIISAGTIGGTLIFAVAYQHIESFIRTKTAARSV